MSNASTVTDALTLVWCAPIYEATGYADEARGILTALEQRAVPVVLRPVQERQVAGFREQLAPAMASALAAQERRSATPPFVLVEHFLADGFVPAPAAAAVVGRTMFETDALPPDWVAACNRMDALWVPSAFNVETFRRSGVTTPMHIVPGGIDCTRFSPDGPALPIAGAHGTVFLSIFEWRTRKGWDVLLRAWADAFGPDDDVTLVLRTFVPGLANVPDAEALINQLIDAFLAEQCQRTRRDVAPIVVLPNLIDEAALPALYRSAHVYVSPTRGEGWGRPFMEAMACGRPVIATRWSAQLAFLHDENSVLVPVDRLVPANDPDMPIYRDTQWAEPSGTSLRDALRDLHTHADRRRAIGERARADMVARWSWDGAATAVLTHFDTLRDRIARAEGTPTPAVTQRVVWDSSLFSPHVASAAQRALVAPLADALVRHGIGITPTRTTSSVRPPLHDPLITAWRAAASIDAVAAVNLTITWCDGAAAATTLTAPPAGRWIVCSGDLTTPEFVACLTPDVRTRVDDLWVSSPHMADAVMALGVRHERLAVYGAWPTLTDEEWTAMYPPTAEHDGSVRVVFPVFTTGDVAGAELMMRLWPRVAPLKSTLSIRVARDGDAAVRTWADHVSTRMQGARADTASLSWMSGAADAIVAQLRQADVLVVASESAQARMWSTTQCALGGTLILPTDMDIGSDATRDVQGSIWRVAPGSNGSLSGTSLTDALREAARARTHERRRTSRAAYEECMGSAHEAAQSLAARVRDVLLAPPAARER